MGKSCHPFPLPQNTELKCGGSHKINKKCANFYIDQELKKKITELQSC